MILQCRFCRLNDKVLIDVPRTNVVQVYVLGSTLTSYVFPRGFFILRLINSRGDAVYRVRSMNRCFDWSWLYKNRKTNAVPLVSAMDDVLLSSILSDSVHMPVRHLISYSTALWMWPQANSILVIPPGQAVQQRAFSQPTASLNWVRLTEGMSECTEMTGAQKVSYLLS